MDIFERVSKKGDKFTSHIKKFALLALALTFCNGERLLRTNQCAEQPAVYGSDGWKEYRCGECMCRGVG